MARDPSLFRTLRHLPPGLLPATMDTIDAIEAEHPDLPGPQDVEQLVPPNQVRWRRRVGASAWWVVYSFSPETGKLFVRTVNRFE